ncbi:MAG TPA: futalosine hydrolase, partial [Lacibacter sp.]|nr:futalosine hydrolase [Lacibacter sp.]
LPGLNLDVLMGGIGLPATAYALTRYLSLQRPDLILQAGVGGCFDRQQPLGTVAVVKKEIIADQGVVEQGAWRTLSDLKLASPNRFPYQQGWLKNDLPLLRQLPLPKVTGITVNQVTTSRQMAALYRERFAPVVESMEGAALHYVARMEQVPFLQLRSMSNYVGERNKARWKMAEAITALNLCVRQILHTLQQRNRT